MTGRTGGGKPPPSSPALDLSRSGTLARRMQEIALDLIREHEADGALPTNLRFLFYEACGRGYVRKSEKGESRRGGAGDPREQEFTEAVFALRDRGVIPWDWITDETRTLTDWEHDPSVFDFVMRALDRATINPWGNEQPPLVLVESRSLGGVLRPKVSLYCCPIAPTNGQVGGFLHTQVAPLLAAGERRVLYLGDADFQGDQIEGNTRGVLERLTGRELDWRRLAITAEQIAKHGLKPVWKKDHRYKPPRDYQAVECEALKQNTIVGLLRAALDELLPEPLADVWEREDEQREAVRAALDALNGEAAP